MQAVTCNVPRLATVVACYASTPSNTVHWAVACKVSRFAAVVACGLCSSATRGAVAGDVTWHAAVVACAGAASTSTIACWAVTGKVALIPTLEACVATTTSASVIPRLKVAAAAAITVCAVVSCVACSKYKLMAQLAKACDSTSKACA